MSARLVGNFALFQLGWLVAVLGAARGYPLAGVLYAGAWALGHHWHVRDGRLSELMFVAASAAFGFVVDSVLVLAGVIAFPDYARLGFPSTIWMVCLWLMFAMTLRHSLGWLRGRYTLAAVLGGVFGPLAYWAGSRLGAIELAETGLAIASVAAAWALSMVGLLRLEAITRCDARWSACGVKRSVSS